MIEHRQDVLPLLDEYKITEREYTNQWSAPDVVHWNGKRQSLYASGVVLGKFREKDHMTMETLEKGVSDTALQEELRLYCKYETKSSKSILKNRTPPFQTSQCNQRPAHRQLRCAGHRYLQQKENVYEPHQ